MPEPTAYLNAVRASTAVLVQELQRTQWSDEDVAAPSLCPGWTRGHVLTHLARNADGIAATLAGATRGEIVPRYPGGLPARDAAISDGAARPFAQLSTDVQDSAERLDRVLAAVADAEAWDARTEDKVPAHRWVLRRWREVEIHHVDLAAGYTPDRWPPLFVAAVVPDAAATLPARASGPLSVEITAAGSLVPELVGRTWTVDRPAVSSSQTAVRAPDWAVLAWLTGRTAAADTALPQAPPLAPWR